MFGLFRKTKKEPDELEIFLYNTATKKKEKFTPLKKGVATMYSCGPTVYDHAHIGNLRSYLVPDLVKRLLEYRGFKVNHTINFTDFGHLTDDGDEGEDKMMKALKRSGKPVTLSAMREVAEIYMDSFKNDFEMFNIKAPTQFTPASDYVKEQINLVKTLVEKGYAYETSDGVYFDITKFPKYGVLGNVDVHKIREGSRVEANPEKRHPADFALWKKALLGWDSAWGKGFPGWHIECTAMAFATLGKQIDIHTGGEDLKYTHHNGEIAQAEAITGKQYVHYWMHNAFLNIDNNKIAKSAGNGITLRSLKDAGYPPDAYRYWLLTGHYRSPMNFTFEALQGARQALFRLKRHIFEDYKNERGSVSTSYMKRFVTALADDLDTPKAIALIWEIVKDAKLAPKDKCATLKEMDKILAIGLSDEPETSARSLGILEEEALPPEIQILVEKREEARKAKDWDSADKLRQALNMKGYAVEDAPQGPKITRSLS